MHHHKIERLRTHEERTRSNNQSSRESARSLREISYSTRSINVGDSKVRMLRHSICIQLHYKFGVVVCIASSARWIDFASLLSRAVDVAALIADPSVRLLLSHSVMLQRITQRLTTVTRHIAQPITVPSTTVTAIQSRNMSAAAATTAKQTEVKSDTLAHAPH